MKVGITLPNLGPQATKENVLQTATLMIVVIVPSDYHKDIKNVLGRLLKFHWEDILDK